jgi:hypothetical protein
LGKKSSSLLAAIGAKLLQIVPKVVGFHFSFDPDEDHIGSRYFGFGILDAVPQTRLVPNDARTSVRTAVTEAIDGAALSAVNFIEQRANFFLLAFKDGTVYEAFLDGGLTHGRPPSEILRRRAS